jgi:hypothetical protein
MFEWVKRNYIINLIYIITINRLCCQSMTYEQYNTMNINKGNNKITELRTILQKESLEDFKCSQCKLELKDLQCTETSKITHQN